MFGNQNCPSRHFRSFSNFAKCRPEVAGDVVYGKTVFYVDVDVRATFGDSPLNSGRIMRRPMAMRNFVILR